MQPILRSALKYFGIFLLLYGALTLVSLIPAVGSFFNQMYRPSSESLLKTLLPKAYIQLKGLENDATVIRVEYASKAKVQQQLREASQSKQSKATIHGMDYQFSFYNLFLSFYLFLIALILLSPLPLKEKGVSLLIGTVLFYLYTVFKMYLILLRIFNEPEIAIYQSSDWSLNIISSMLYFMTMGTNVLVVLILWAVLVFRKNNWRELLKVQE